MIDVISTRKSQSEISPVPVPPYSSSTLSFSSSPPFSSAPLFYSPSRPSFRLIPSLFLPSVPCFSSAQPFSRLPLHLPHLFFFIFLHQHPQVRVSETGPLISIHSGAPTKEKKAPYLNPLRDTYLLKLAVPHLT